MKLWSAILDYLDPTRKEGREEEKEAVDASEPTSGKFGPQEFRVSKPYGYFMQDVDEYVAEAKKVLTGKDATIYKLEQEIAKRDRRIVELQYEISTMEIPSIEDSVGQTIISAAEAKLNIHPSKNVRQQNQKIDPPKEDEAVTVFFDE